MVGSGSSQMGNRLEVVHEKPWEHRSAGPVSWDKFPHAYGRKVWWHRHDPRPLARTISGILPKIAGAETVIVQDAADRPARTKGRDRLEVLRPRADRTIRLIRRADCGDSKRCVRGLFPPRRCRRVPGVDAADRPRVRPVPPVSRWRPSQKK